MKKQVKVITTILMILAVLFTISNIILATDSKTAIIDGISTSASSTSVTSTNLTSVGGKIVAVVQVIGIIVAVVVLLILGIKYMVGSAEEKAEYKKTMVPYIVGALIVFGATSIVKVVYDLANSVNIAQ